LAKQRVLIVEDEAEIAELIRFHLERDGFEAKTAGSGKAGLEAAERWHPHIVLLDLMLPDLSGLEVCRKMKWQAELRDIPVIMVTARGEESDVVAGIELGADDYITKPFSPKVLVARVRSVLRRLSGRGEGETQTQRLEIGQHALTIDADRHQVSVDGRAVDLTVTEFGILRYLAMRPGFVRTRDQIIAAVHGGYTVLSSRTIDVHVTALRRKLGDAGALIETVRGVGYRLADAVPATVE